MITWLIVSLFIINQLDIFVMYRRSSQSPLSKTKNRSQHAQLDQKRTPARSHTVHNEDKLKVLIKFKPFPKQEQNQQVRYLTQHSIQIKTSLKNKIYQFDYVFNGKESWQKVFEMGCKDIIDNVFLETLQQHPTNHGLVFVYGNTGTGKTYSMGLLDCIKQKSNGIVPDSIRYIFNMKKKKPYQQYTVSISFGQVYMDEVYDLLDLQSQLKLTLREDSKTKEHYVENQMVIEVRSPQQAFQILNIGLDKRRIAEQKMNRRSSRGHGMITINLDPGNGQKPGRLCFIDLAGCQRLKDSESKGTTLSEALHINSSLSSLQTLLMNVSEQNIRSYRSSKLTRLLQPYIQHGKINLFVTTTAESLNAIQFAKRCKGIKFMQRDLRQSTTPIKRSGITEKGNNKSNKEVQELILFKKQAIEKEKKMLEYIQSLLNSINRLTNQMQNCLKTQKFPTKFSFSDIINNAELQRKINQKIQSHEQKQQILVKQLAEKLSMSSRNEFYITQTLKFQDLSQISKCQEQHIEDLSQTLRGITALASYRNTYKKQLFTSELKCQLLQQRCKKFQDGIYNLVKYLNTSDKRVVKRLKQLGINWNENNQNHSSVRNKQILKHEKHSSKSVLQEQNSNARREQSLSPPSSRLSPPLDISERRGAIFIDQT